jgi:hypothetical protein
MIIQSTALFLDTLFATNLNLALPLSSLYEHISLTLTQRILSHSLEARYYALGLSPTRDPSETASVLYNRIITKANRCQYESTDLCCVSPRHDEIRPRDHPAPCIQMRHTMPLNKLRIR